MNAPTEKERALANLRHLYQQMAGGQVKDSAQAKRIADGLLSPAIAKLKQAARRDPAVPVPQIDPVHGDCLPPIGSRVFIRHGRDDDAHACIVTGYYAWGDLKGSKHLHRVFVQMVYEGTDTKQARMLCDCYATAEAALAAALQPPACNPSMQPELATYSAPVQLPEPAAWVFKDRTWTEIRAMAVDHGGVPAYTEHQVRELLAQHSIK